MRRKEQEKNQSAGRGGGNTQGSRENLWFVEGDFYQQRESEGSGRKIMQEKTVEKDIVEAGYTPQGGSAAKRRSSW